MFFWSWYKFSQFRKIKTQVSEMIFALTRKATLSCLSFAAHSNDSFHSTPGMRSRFFDIHTGYLYIPMGLQDFETMLLVLFEFFKVRI